MMDQFLQSEILTTVATFMAGMLAVLMVQGLNALISGIKNSGNKVDDALLPVLEAVRDALDTMNKQQAQK
jgi:hypothetical protein